MLDIDFEFSGKLKPIRGKTPGISSRSPKTRPKGSIFSARKAGPSALSGFR